MKHIAGFKFGWYLQEIWDDLRHKEIGLLGKYTLPVEQKAEHVLRGSYE